MISKEKAAKVFTVCATASLLVLSGCRGLSTGTTPPCTTCGSLQSVDHVVFMLQENRSFDTYFGMLNPYRQANGWNVGDDGKTYTVDGIDDKLTQFAQDDDEGQPFSLFKFQSTCIDDMTSAWQESYGDVDRYDFSTTRAISMNGFVHTAEGYAKSGAGDGQFTDLVGQRAMGYYDQGILNYYYYMASQFALSDRWFSPVSSKSTPNRIATMTGGTTQGLVHDPFVDDGITTQLTIPTIFEELDQSNVPWRIYYSITAGGCTEEDGDCGPWRTVQCLSRHQLLWLYLFDEIRLRKSHASRLHCAHRRLATSGRRFEQCLLHRHHSHRASSPIHDRRSEQFTAELCLHRSCLRSQ
jgi:phospholipase C